MPPLQGWQNAILSIECGSPWEQRPPIDSTGLPATALGSAIAFGRISTTVIRKLKSGEYRLYSRKKNPRTEKRRNLGTFRTVEEAKKHERAVQFFKRH